MIELSLIEKISDKKLINFRDPNVLSAISLLHHETLGYKSNNPIIFLFRFKDKIIFSVKIS